MKYYFSTTLDMDFDLAIQRTTEALKTEGFGVLTEIDVKATMKKKLDQDFRPYQILGACNPHYAFEALNHEDKIGTMLPCSVIVQGLDNGKTEVAAIDPVASMQAVDNPNLEELANKVREALKRAVESL